VSDQGVFQQLEAGKAWGPEQAGSNAQLSSRSVMLEIQNFIVANIGQSQSHSCPAAHLIRANNELMHA
jgi:hypothetical protein